MLLVLTALADGRFSLLQFKVFEAPTYFSSCFLQLQLQIVVLATAQLGYKMLLPLLQAQVMDTWASLEFQVIPASALGHEMLVTGNGCSTSGYLKP